MRKTRSPQMANNTSTHDTSTEGDDIREEDFTTSSFSFGLCELLAGSEDKQVHPMSTGEESRRVSTVKKSTTKKHEQSAESEESHSDLFTYDRYEVDWEAQRCHFYFSGNICSATKGKGNRVSVRWRSSLSWRAPEKIEAAFHSSQSAEKKAFMEATLFNIGLCILPWYWMPLASTKIRISAGQLDVDQVQFWLRTYQHVLAEYLYVNGLPLSVIVLEVVDGDRRNATGLTSGPIPVLSRYSPSSSCPGNLRVLVPLGGGKDSLTVASLLKERDIPFDWIYVGDKPRPQGFEDDWRLQAIVREFSTVSGHNGKSAGKAGVSSLEPGAIVFEHDFFAQEWEDAVGNFRLVACGHPWAALVAMDSVLAALLYGYDYILVGNERSANEGNNIWHDGIAVNHQYDKSWSFEEQLHNYIKRYLSPTVHYASALQQWHEVQIAERFCRLCPSLLPLFLSCNDTESSRWCAKCAKCAFVFLLLSAWLDPPEVWAIVGDNLYEERSLFPVFLQLMGRGATSTKPFECVGTVEEVLLSLYLARERYLQRDPKSRYLPAFLRETDVSEGARYTYLLTEWNDVNLLPYFLQDLKEPLPKCSD